jgi:hypothetical protein
MAYATPQTAIVATIDRMEDDIPAVVIAHLPNGVILAGVHGLRAAGLTAGAKIS